MASVMSTVEPAGTWQYAQAVCLPAGARDGSQRPYWTNSTYGAVGVAPGGDLGFGGGHLLERPAEMDRAGPPDGLGGPRDGAIERPVHLEDATAVAEGLVAPSGEARQAMAGDREQLAGCDVQDRHPVRRQRRAGRPRDGPSRPRPRALRVRRRVPRRRPAPHRGPSASRPRGRTCRGRVRTMRSMAGPAAASRGLRCLRTAPSPVRPRSGCGRDPPRNGAPGNPNRAIARGRRGAWITGRSSSRARAS